MYRINQNQFDQSITLQMKDPRRVLLSIASAMLLNEDKFYSSKNDNRDQLFDALLHTADGHPEFILQLAAYLRNKLYVRSATNFILAFATEYNTTRPYCKKYFKVCVKLPGDMIEICKYQQVQKYYFNPQWIGYYIYIPMDLEVRKQIYLSKALQKLIKVKFSDFDTYQLGKYCSERARKNMLRNYLERFNYAYRQHQIKRRMKKNQKRESWLKRQTKKCRKQIHKKEAQTIQQRRQKCIEHYQPKEQKGVLESEFLSMRDIVKLCHISEPKLQVLQILGHKYPMTEEQYKVTFGDVGQFDPNQAGKRMKVPIPMTWEREISKKAGWDTIIEKNALPYMAMIRNLRNIANDIKVSANHALVMEKITNQQMIKHSKMFPMQFFKPLLELNKVRQALVDDNQTTNLNLKKFKQLKVQRESELKKLDDYITALNEAIGVSMGFLNSIEGVTHIFIDCSQSMRIQLGKKETLLTNSFLLAQLIRMKCEYCEVYLYSAPKSVRQPYTKINFYQDTLLEAVQRCKEQFKLLNEVGSMLEWTLDDLLLAPKTRVDNIIVVTDMLYEKEGGKKYKDMTLSDVISSYTETVNPQAKFYFIDPVGTGMAPTNQGNSSNVYTVSGLTDKVIQYIGFQNVDQLNEVLNYQIN